MKLLKRTLFFLSLFFSLEAQGQLIINPYQFGFEAEYQAILDHATTLGYTKPSAAQQVKQNQLVKDLKSAGIWTLLDIFYVFATDGSSDFATLNWKSPTTFQCTKVNSPTFTANQGFTGNGSTSYLSTQFTPSTNAVNLTLNSASYIVGIVTNVASLSQNDFGGSGASNANATRFNSRTASPSADLITGRVHTTAGGGVTLASTITSSVGFHQLQRINSSTIVCYKNGSSLGSVANSSNALTAVTLFLLGENANGSLTNPSTRQISVFGAGASLNGLESSLYTAWNTYFTSL